MLIRVHLHFIIGELRYHYKLRGFNRNSKPLSYPEFTPCFSWVRVTRSLVVCACFCRSLFVLLSFFFWPLCFLFFFDIGILITTLVSSNSSYSCTWFVNPLYLNLLYFLTAVALNCLSRLWIVFVFYLGEGHMSLLC